MTYLFAFFIAAYAAISDIKSRRISNSFIAKSYIVGILIQTFFIVKKGSVSDMGNVLAALTIPYVLLLVIYILGGIGAADIKLLSVIGMLIGIRLIVKLMIVSFLVGGVIGIFSWLLTKNKRIPFAVAIFISLTGLLILNYTGGKFI